MLSGKYFVKIPTRGAGAAASDDYKNYHNIDRGRDNSDKNDSRTWTNPYYHDSTRHMYRSNSHSAPSSLDHSSARSVADNKARQTDTKSIQQG